MTLKTPVVRLLAPFIAPFISPLFAPLILLVLSAACSPDIQEVDVKEFRLLIKTDHVPTRLALSNLISAFNSEVGFYAIQEVTQEADANSFMTVKEGLYTPEGRNLGWGQWVIESETESPAFFIHTGELQRTNKHSMNIELDRNFIQKRVDQPSEDGQLEMKTLVWHEIGHGFQLDHEDDHNSVMYPEVDKTPRDFAVFFQKIRTYFGR